MRKVGIQTNIWGSRLTDIRQVLKQIAHYGYRGVEFGQRPDMLGIRNIDELLELLDEHNLSLLGITSGTLLERIRFCNHFRPAYLYIEEWEGAVAEQALAAGFTLALHPSVFTQVNRIERALKVIDQHPELRLLPDTAHLAVAGDNFLDLIQRAHSKIVAVHLKDWTPVYGRFSHRCARGFVELGAGVVKLEAILDELDQVAFNGWVVVEQNSKHIRPEATVFHCSQWLANRGHLPKAPEWTEKTNLATPPENHNDGNRAVVDFVRAAVRSHIGGIDTFYPTVAQIFGDLVSSELVTVWACSAQQHSLSLLAVHPEGKYRLGPHTLTYRGQLSGDAVEGKRITRHKLTDPANHKRLGNSDLLAQLTATEMISIPILNPWNPNHVRHVVNIFTSGANLPLSDSQLALCAEDIALVADAILIDLCLSSAARTAMLAGKYGRAEVYAYQLTQFIRQQINCEGVSLFRVDDIKSRLEPYASPPIYWTVPLSEQFYRLGEGLTGMAWEECRPVLTPNAPDEDGHKGKAIERVEGEAYNSCMIVPILNSHNDVWGVVRCRNRRAILPGDLSAFLDDDLAVVDAICQEAVQHLQTMIADETRMKAVMKLTHELRGPIGAIRGATESLTEQLAERRVQLDYDFVGDIQSWVDLMRRLMGNADMMQYRIQSLPLTPARTLLMAEIIAPAVRQVEALLRERSFSAKNIRYSSFRAVPRLWVDRNQMQQVIFNLLSNSIKYGYSDPNAFQVEIEGQYEHGRYLVRFRDWGTGIEEAMKEAVFQEGVRSHNAQSNVAGQGLGLWVVQQIIHAHDGEVKVTKTKFPTELTVSLPEYLAHQGPKRPRKV